LLVYIEGGEVEFVLVCTLYLSGYVNKTGELLFPHMIDSFAYGSG